MRTVITKEIEVIICDICGEESDIITKCRVCGKDICNNCRMWDQCEECWTDNCSFADIKRVLSDKYDYTGEPQKINILNHESDEKWNSLLYRFIGKKVKITIEEFPKHEKLHLKI